MVTEGELRNNSLDDSDKVKELQDKVADLKAEVSYMPMNFEYFIFYIHDRLFHTITFIIIFH